MRLTAIPLLTAICAGCCTTPAPDAQDCYASEAARTDLVCSDGEETAEAQEPFSILTATCIVGVALAAHLGCKHLLLEAMCPAGTERTIRDTWDRHQSFTVDCSLLQELLCGAGAVAAEDFMRTACGAVP